jgi:8-oxo-dGTP diphosphatase
MRYEYAVNVFVFNSDYTSLLFVRREKPPFAGQFLPPGGHVELGENPLEAAVREVREETGLEIEVMDFRPGSPIVLDSRTIRMPEPIRVQMEYIDRHHKHVDFILMGEVTGDSDRIPDTFKEQVKWVSVNELKDMEMPRNVKELAFFLFRYKQED